MKEKFKQWVIRHCTGCMIVTFVFALLGAQIAKFYLDAPFHEAVTQAIQTLGL